MEISKIKVGKTYSYYPPTRGAKSNQHFPAVAEAIGTSRVRIRYFMEGAEQGIIRNVASTSLADQVLLF
jgi:hypothetical protein